ncbi:MAG: hypothetical protein OYL92_04750 [Acidobacteriota bacterium]|nr:hypothetical protein [Acidobacteriota bacterium]MDE2924613.1 hypothetical protein [Acidobacteriota bacterium]MDE3264263.1 hypothetical protein [Acidobacteriota bacterium]
MGRSENSEPGANRPGTPMSLTDEDITTVRVDRRSFLSRAVAVGSLAAAAVVTTACPGGTDSDGEGDAAAPAESEQATDSDQQ